MGRFPAWPAILILSACATQAQREATNIHNAMSKAAQDFLQCSSAIDRNPEYSSIITHVPTSGSSAPTLQQMSDTTAPNPIQRFEILVWRQAKDNCYDRSTTEISAVFPEAAEAIQEHRSAVDNVYMSLSRGETSWGEAMIAVRQDQLSLQAKLNSASGVKRQELMAEHQAELQRRQAAAEMFVRTMQTQQLINQQQQIINQSYAPRVISPIQTTCSQIGSFTNCTSQ